MIRAAVTQDDDVDQFGWLPSAREHLADCIGSLLGGCDALHAGALAAVLIERAARYGSPIVLIDENGVATKIEPHDTAGQAVGMIGPAFVVGTHGLHEEMRRVSR